MDTAKLTAARLTARGFRAHVAHDGRVMVRMTPGFTHRAVISVVDNGYHGYMDTPHTGRVLLGGLSFPRLVEVLSR